MDGILWILSRGGDFENKVSDWLRAALYVSLEFDAPILEPSANPARNLSRTLHANAKTRMRTSRHAISVVSPTDPSWQSLQSVPHSHHAQTQTELLEAEP